MLPVGSHGDAHPLVALGEAMQRRGHDVYVLVNPHFETMVRNAGLKFEPLGTEEQFREVLGDPNLWSARKAIGVVARGMAQLLPMSFDAIERLAIHGETIVVAGSLGLAARVADEALGIPSVTVHLQPSVMLSVDEPPVFPEIEMRPWWPRWLRRGVYSIIHRVIDRAMAEPLNALRSTRRLPPVRRVMDTWWHSPRLVLGLFPEWFATPAPDWPVQTQLTGFPLYDESRHSELPTEAADFLKAGTPPIVFTFGSAMTQAESLFAAAVQICERLGRRGLLLARFDSQIPQMLPHDVAHFQYIPLSQVLPSAAAIVHHGGMGTMAQAFAAGIPQLVVPFAHDQFDNGARLERLGCGRSLPRRRFRAETATQWLRTMMADPAVAESTRVIAANFKVPADPLAAAVDAIERTAESAGVRGATIVGPARIGGADP
jgi:rhamnosyltransferase subunit B